MRTKVSCVQKGDRLRRRIIETVFSTWRLKVTTTGETGKRKGAERITVFRDKLPPAVAPSPLWRPDHADREDPLRIDCQRNIRFVVRKIVGNFLSDVDSFLWMTVLPELS
jgi:hypothetical protein